jgi:hypothetical protein
VGKLQVLEGMVQGAAIVGVISLKLSPSVDGNHFEERKRVLHIILQHVLDYRPPPGHYWIEIWVRSGVEGEAEGECAVGQVERDLKEAVFQGIPSFVGELEQGTRVASLEGSVLRG